MFNLAYLSRKFNQLFQLLLEINNHQKLNMIQYSFGDKIRVITILKVKNHLSEVRISFFLVAEVWRVTSTFENF